MRYETHSFNQLIYWRHSWRLWHDDDTVTEFDALEYNPGPLVQHALDNPDAFCWTNDGVPWMGDIVAEHSRTPLYPQHQPVPGHCALLNCNACYYVGSTPAAEMLVSAWLCAGRDNDVVWEALRARKPVTA